MCEAPAAPDLHVARCGAGGIIHAAFPESAYQSSAHSNRFPCMSWSPHALGALRPTGCVSPGIVAIPGHRIEVAGEVAGRPGAAGVSTQPRWKAVSIAVLPLVQLLEEALDVLPSRFDCPSS